MKQTQRTPFVILGLLGLRGRQSTTGYELKKAIDSTISQFWSESFGQIYPVLKQLASAGFVRSANAKEKGRKQIRYTITAKGTQHLRHWLEKPPGEATVRNELILKLLFGSMTEVQVLIDHLVTHRDQAKRTLADYRQWQEQVKAQKTDYQPYQMIILNAGIAQSESFVRWADQTLETLGGMKEKA